MVDREKGTELLDLPEVGGAELVERDRLVILVLVVEGVEAGRDGIEVSSNSPSFSRHCYTNCYALICVAVSVAERLF